MTSAVQLARERYRQRQRYLSVLVAAASTGILGTLLVVAVTGAPGWQRVKASFFDLQTAWRSLPAILHGLVLNLELLVGAGIGAVVVGLLIAGLRTLRAPVFFPLRLFSGGYTYMFRGAPLVIVLYVFTLGVPGLRLRGTPNVLVLGGCALVIVYGAYMAEVFRAGIESVHVSQWAASRSLGLTYWQTLRHVVLPQAVRRVAPPLLNDLVALQKDVGLISLAGPIDAVRAAQISVAESYNYTPYVVAGVIFVLMAVPLIAVTDWVTLRAARRQSADAGR